MRKNIPSVASAAVSAVPASQIPASVPRPDLQRVIDRHANTPADGMVTGIGSINGALFGPERSRTVVMAYDATVLAGTKGVRNHHKTDRLLGIALVPCLPFAIG